MRRGPGSCSGWVAAGNRQVTGKRVKEPPPRPRQGCAVPENCCYSPQPPAPRRQLTSAFKPNAFGQKVTHQAPCVNTQNSNENQATNPYLEGQSWVPRPGYRGPPGLALRRQLYPIPPPLCPRAFAQVVPYSALHFQGARWQCPPSPLHAPSPLEKGDAAKNVKFPAGPAAISR